MEKFFSVKEVAALLGYKNEETIKRKLKDGLFPNAFQNSRKEGWKIPASDVATLAGSSLKKVQRENKSSFTDYNKFELVKLAYQIATLTSPPEGVRKALTSLPLEHALKICLILRQQSRPIDDPFKFVKAAITKKWTPDPITYEKKKSLVDFTQRDFEGFGLKEQRTGKIPLYNWLEQE
ncbi:helix-turn-helix transcriptional regulator [Bacillus toyonensis]|uniref:helix-turn-helix transcriptional regulator n=1 Tax=Bacillus toyonensis TaxID=155322 RepID=UPI0037F8BE64